MNIFDPIILRDKNNNTIGIYLISICDGYFNGYYKYQLTNFFEIKK